MPCLPPPRRSCPLAGLLARESSESRNKAWEMEKEIEVGKERTHSPPSSHVPVLSLPSHTGALSPFPSQLGSGAEAIKETNNFFCCLASPAPEQGRILQPCPRGLCGPAPRHSTVVLQPLTTKSTSLN